MNGIFRGGMLRG